MKTRVLAVLSLLAATASAAEDAGVDAVGAWQADPTTIFQAAEVDMADFLWIARPVVVFANTPADPAFIRQVELIEARIGELASRDVVVLLDSDPEANSSARQTLRPRGFALAIVNKDGRVALRKPSPWDVREITRSIDKTPERQQEMSERRETLTD